MPVAIETRAKIACLYAGAVWGLFWIPLRAMEDAGLHNLWITTIYFLVPAMCMLPVLGLRWEVHPAGRCTAPTNRYGLRSRADTVFRLDCLHRGRSRADAVLPHACMGIPPGARGAEGKDHCSPHRRHGESQPWEC